MTGGGGLSEGGNLAWKYLLRVYCVAGLDGSLVDADVADGAGEDAVDSAERRHEFDVDVAASQRRPRCRALHEHLRPVQRAVHAAHRAAEASGGPRRIFVGAWPPTAHVDVDAFHFAPLVHRRHRPIVACTAVNHSGVAEYAELYKSPAIPIL